MNGHTPEPWAVDPTGDVGAWSIGSVEHGEIAQCLGDAPTDTIDIANARRIVACVNVCRDLSTEALERLASEGKTLEFALANSVGDGRPLG